MAHRRRGCNALAASCIPEGAAMDPYPVTHEGSHRLPSSRFCAEDAGYFMR